MLKDETLFHWPADFIGAICVVRDFGWCFG